MRTAIIMIKNIFNYFVRFLFLFGAVSSFNPSHAGKNNNREEEIKEKSNHYSFQVPAVMVTLSPTKVPHSVKDFDEDFVYGWELESAFLEAIPDNPRIYAETVPFINLDMLMGLAPNISEDQQYTVLFTKENIQTFSDLYYQGKLQLSWFYNGVNFHQYCAHAQDPFHTLAVAPNRKNVTYYRQQRYSDDQFLHVADVCFDSQYQTEYWFDDEKKSWVINDADEGEIEYSTRQSALTTMKVRRALNSAEDESLSFFVDPLTRWEKESAEKSNEGKSTRQLWKTALIGWLSLTGGPFSNIANRVVGQPQSSKNDVVTGSLYSQSFEKKFQGDQRHPQEYGESFTSIISNFSPYDFISPLLMSLVSSKDGKISPLHFYSAASILLPIVQGTGIESQQQKITCKNEDSSKAKAPERYFAKSAPNFYLPLHWLSIDQCPSIEDKIDTVGSTPFDEGKLLSQAVEFFSSSTCSVYSGKLQLPPEYCLAFEKEQINQLSFIMAKKLIQDLSFQTDKNFRIIAGESHNKVSDFLLELGLLQLASSLGVTKLLIECSPQHYEDVMRKALISSSSSLKTDLMYKKIQAAVQLGMEVVPIDIDNRPSSLSGSDGVCPIMEAIYNPEREGAFCHNSFEQKGSFIAFIGRLHTSYFPNRCKEINKEGIISYFLFSSKEPAEKTEEALKQFSVCKSFVSERYQENIAFFDNSKVTVISLKASDLLDHRTLSRLVLLGVIKSDELP